MTGWATPSREHALEFYFPLEVLYASSLSKADKGGSDLEGLDVPLMVRRVRARLEQLPDLRQPCLVRLPCHLGQVQLVLV